MKAEANMKNRSKEVNPDQGGRPAGESKIRLGTVNVGTLSGKANEIAEMLTRRNVDLCCLQETRWRGGSSRQIKGKDSIYKLFWCGDQSGFRGIGIMLAQKWVNNVLSVKRYDNRCLQLRFLIGTIVINVICCYAPQSGLPVEEKDTFYERIFSIVASVPDEEILFIGGDFNGHVGEHSDGFEGIHGGNGYGLRNQDGLRILDFSCFSSGGNHTQIDYILVRRTELKNIKDTKVISSEECITQHKILVSDLVISAKATKPIRIPPRRKTWKLRDSAVQKEFEQAVLRKCQDIPADIEGLWTSIKNVLLDAADETCGWTRGGCPRHKETWWWNSDVDNIIKEKRKAWQQWKKGGSKEDYLKAKKTAKTAVYHAKKDAQTKQFSSINNNSDKTRIFKIAKRLKQDNVDIVGEKCVRNNDGNLALTIDDKLKTWQSHYQKLLNIEFLWDTESLSEEAPVEGPAIKITSEMVSNAMSKMKSGKAAGPSGIIIEMVRAGGDRIITCLASLFNQVIYDLGVPGDWNLSYIINLFKGKGDALCCGNYRGLKLQEQVMKILEHVLNSIIRDQVSIDNMQFGFMPGRGTTDAIFILRQLQEKYLLKKKNIYFAFVDLEKAFDRVPRKILWWAMRKVKIDEWIIQVVKSMYDNAQSKIRITNSYSDPVNVSVGVHQGSVLSPLLFVIVMEALSCEFRIGCPWELLYADDLVIVAESLEELQMRLSTWKSGLENKGLKVNVAKTKILLSSHDAKRSKIAAIKYPCGVCMKGVGANSILCESCKKWIHKRCSGIKGSLRNCEDFVCNACIAVEDNVDHLPTSLSIDNDEFEIVSQFCYLGDIIGQAGGCVDAVTARIGSAWKAFHELLPILTNRGISLANRGKVFNACVRTVLLYGSETWALSTEDLGRIKRCDHAMIRWLCNVKIEQKHTTDDLRKRIYVHPIEDVLRWNRLRLSGHLHRQEDTSCTKSILNLDIDGPTPRGRPKLRWKDVINADLRKKGLNITLASDRCKWRNAIRPGTQQNGLQPTMSGRRRGNDQ